MIPESNKSPISPVPADEDPLYQAQIQGLKSMTKLIDAEFLAARDDSSAKPEVPKKQYESLVAKLLDLKPAVEQQKLQVYQRVDDIVQRQRELEGIRAAMRDPVSGKVYTGWSHQAAIESVPTTDETGAWGRLSTEWDRSTENSGFMDREGRFISRTEAEARWGVLTMEDVKDVRNPPAPRFV